MPATPARRGEEGARKRILLTSHCVLNQNAVVQPLARSTGVMKSAADWAVDQGWGIFQLPCPEFRFAGPGRRPATFDDYNTDEFHRSNRELLAPVISRLRRYRDAGYEIVGGLHVKGSPACDPDTGNWVTDILRAAEEAGIEITDLWQIPDTPTGEFDPDDATTRFGDAAGRRVFPDDAATVTEEDRRRIRRPVGLGPVIPVRSRAEGVS